jgi:hypothetical protein
LKGTVWQVSEKALCILGALMSIILLHDLVGYRILGENRYCVVAYGPVDELEESGVIDVEIVDTGSGCSGSVAICVRARVLLSDVRREC